MVFCSLFLVLVENTTKTQSYNRHKGGFCSFTTKDTKGTKGTNILPFAFRLLPLFSFLCSLYLTHNRFASIIKHLLIILK